MPTVKRARAQAAGQRRPSPATRAGRLLLAALLGVAAALLVACGSSGTAGLIPVAKGSPLQSDIEAVEQAAKNGNGNCSATEAALLRTDQDFAALPSSINAGLRSNLRQGVENLHKVATTLCSQPLAQTATTTTPNTTTTTTTTPTQTTPTQTTPTQTTPTSTTTTPTTPETPETPGPGGGTPAPGEGKAPEEGAGGAPPEGGSGNGAGGSEGGK